MCGKIWLDFLISKLSILLQGSTQRSDHCTPEWDFGSAHFLMFSAAQDPTFEYWTASVLITCVLHQISIFFRKICRFFALLAKLSKVEGVKFEASFMSVWASLYLGSIGLLGFWGCSWMQPSYTRDQSTQGENFSLFNTVASTVWVGCS
ncbi:hypothetical protein AAC387_Pa07g3034 [Persea americana]